MEAFRLQRDSGLGKAREAPAVLCQTDRCYTDEYAMTAQKREPI